MTHIRFPDPDEDAHQLVECEPMAAADGTSLVTGCLRATVLTPPRLLPVWPPHQSRRQHQGLRCQCLAGAWRRRRVHVPLLCPS